LLTCGIVSTLAGAFLFIALFLPFYTLNAFGFRSSGSGWQALTYLDVLLAVGAAGILAAGILLILSAIPSTSLPYKLPTVVCWAVSGVSAASGALVLVRIIELPPGLNSFTAQGIDIGRGAGIVLALIASLCAMGSALYLLFLGGLGASTERPAPAARTGTDHPAPPPAQPPPPNPTDRMS
jgi:hypothetical protein